jgi:polar amino acid transport system substrate-binding protein
LIPIKPAVRLEAARRDPSRAPRAAINLGNAVLGGRDAATGAPKGVTVDLAGKLDERLGVALELVAVDGRRRRGGRARPARCPRRVGRAAAL